MRPDHLVIWVAFGTTLLRYVFCQSLPIFNDEAYYGDWAKSLALSYFDHPPGVAILGWIGQSLLPGAIGTRFLAPVCHFGSVIFLWKTFRLIEPSACRRDAWIFSGICHMIPGLSLWGCLLLPDTGLLLSLSVALYIGTRIISSETSWLQVLSFGVALGIAGLCKYHAAFCALGMLIVMRPMWNLRLLVGLGIACLITAPVWIWNYDHDWASFRYQGAHGFSGGSFDLLAFARALLGQMVLFSPLPFIMLWQHARKRLNIALRFQVAAGLVLLLLIEGSSFFKQTLPHWILPSVWLFIPVMTMTASKMSRRRWLGSLIPVAIVTAVAPVFLALGGPSWLIRSAGQPPGHMAEITLWPHLAASVREVEFLHAPQNPDCVFESIPIGSFRWYMVAQLSYHLGSSTQVYSFDPGARNFYFYRDDHIAWSGCKVLLVGESRWFDRPDIKEKFEIIQISHLSPHLHETMDFRAALALAR